MNRHSFVPGSLVLAVGMAMSGQASAVTVTRDYLSHGTANCQSALPVFDGNVRKRPMAVANEGTTTAFITCDSESINNTGTGFTEVAVYLRNRAGAAGITVGCTLVEGAFIATGSFPKTSGAIPGAGGTSQIIWTIADNANNVFVSPAVSCALPPGVDISLMQFKYAEDVGA